MDISITENFPGVTSITFLWEGANTIQKQAASELDSTNTLH